jgi:hypothetical protein
MTGMSNALQELRAERSRAQSQVERLDQAISVIESLNGTSVPNSISHKATQPKRIISVASRRKMALAQKARWAEAKVGSQPVVGAVKTKGAATAKSHTMSAAARKKIGVAMRARWAKIKAENKK